jgi:predicted ATPase/DNA-binding SARP family transcriptional activator
MEFRLLGPLELATDGSPPSVGSPKQRALLAFLLLHANEVVSSDRLIEALWGERPPATAAHAVQVYVSRLRKTLGAAATDPPQLATRAAGYVLELAPDRLDVAQFERFRSEGKEALERGDAEAAAEKLREALALWRGPALADFSYEPFAQEEIARLEELRLAALEDRIDADLQLARHADLVPELERLVAEHPLRERLRAQLMLALYRGGRQADALAAYREGRQLLRTELGLEPTPHLRELEAAILRQDAALAIEPPDVRARRHLPAPATAFIGRDAEIEELVALLQGDVRLLTLTGPGGIGKTRLAIEVAARLADRFADGVFFVDLASTRDPSVVSAAVAHALGLREEGGTEPAEVLAEHVRGLRLLLVLDNFEQIEPAAPLVGDVLRASAGSKALVTSRSPLRVYGEFEFGVPPLSLSRGNGKPSPETSDAFALFVARARATRRGLDLAEHDPVAVAEICTRLDGLPLALELAAARTRELSPEQMLAGLPRRLELTTEGPRDVPARQQTLRATLEWSYDLLAEREQELFARLAVFAGGWTGPAAEAVTGAGEEAVRALVDKSLVVSEDSGGAVRFRMLELIREYALERLAELPDADAVRGRQAEYFCEVGEQAEAELWGGEDGGPLDRLERDHENLRTALAWLHANGEPEQELRLVIALKLFWWVRGYLTEGRRWLDAALERDGAHTPALRATALVAAGVLAFKQADYERAKALLDESLALYRSLEDDEGIARALGELGAVAAGEGDYTRASALYEESRDLYRSLGDTVSLATVLANLGDIALNRGDAEAAARLCEEALALQRESGDKEGAATSLFNLSRAALHGGRRADAATYLHESLDVARTIRYRELIAYCLEGVAGVAAESRDRAARAARVAGAAEALLEETGIVLQSYELELYEQTLARLRATLGDSAFENALAEGQQLALDDAVIDALELAAEIAATEPVTRT